MATYYSDGKLMRMEVFTRFFKTKFLGALLNTLLGITLNLTAFKKTAVRSSLVKLKLHNLSW